MLKSVCKAQRIETLSDATPSARSVPPHKNSRNTRRHQSKVELIWRQPGSRTVLYCPSKAVVMNAFSHVPPLCN